MDGRERHHTQPRLLCVRVVQASVPCTAIACMVRPCPTATARAATAAAAAAAAATDAVEGRPEAADIHGRVCRHPAVVLLPAAGLAVCCIRMPLRRTVHVVALPARHKQHSCAVASSAAALRCCHAQRGVRNRVCRS
jgi:hypothetical protein